MVKTPILIKIKIIFGFLILVYPRIKFNINFFLKVKKTPKMPGEIKIRVLNDGIFEFGFQIRNLCVRFSGGLLEKTLFDTTSFFMSNTQESYSSCHRNFKLNEIN